MSNSDLCFASAGELGRLIRQREISPVDVVKASLARIEAVNPKLNAFCFVHAEEALDAARVAEQAVMDGRPLGRLHGIPVAFKDMTATKGQRTTLGSRAFRDWIPDHDAPIVTALKAAGAIVVGKTTTPEFAFSSFTNSPLWGVTRNPWDASRTSGGSSGGSAVAVATGCVALAEGSDMGGSVRIPASFCGIAGLKPSLGRIPFTGLPSTFETIAHFGPLARNCADASLFLFAAQGPHDEDILSLPCPLAEEELRPRDPATLRVAFSPDLGFFAIDPDVRDNTRRVAEGLAAMGAVVEEVRLDWTSEIVSAWADYWYVYLAAFYGALLDTQRDDLDPAVVRRMEKGLRMNAVAYKKIEILRTRMWRTLAALLRDFDILICPTMAKTAPPATGCDDDFGGKDESGLYKGLDLTCPFNFVGQCPALSVPSGLDRHGLPTGIQLVGRRFADLDVLRIGSLVEQLVGPLQAPFGSDSTTFMPPSGR